MNRMTTHTPARSRETIYCPLIRRHYLVSRNTWFLSRGEDSLCSELCQENRAIHGGFTEGFLVAGSTCVPSAEKRRSPWKWIFRAFFGLPIRAKCVYCLNWDGQDFRIGRMIAEDGQKSGFGDPSYIKTECLWIIVWREFHSFHSKLWKVKGLKKP